MPHVCHTPTLFGFVVDGPIVGKERARVVTRQRPGERRMVRAYTPAKTKRAESSVRLAWSLAGARRACDACPLRLSVVAIMPRPKSHYATTGELSSAGLASVAPTKRPDLDNVAKLVMDALNGHAWRDDAQVCDLRTQKAWGDCGMLRVSVSCFCVPVSEYALLTT